MTAAEACEACGRPLGLTARNEDPSTSHDAGRMAAECEGKVRDVRPNTQRHKLLLAYMRCLGPDIGIVSISDEQAASLADLHYQGTCWWKRCSELRQGGFIEPTGQVEGFSGATVRVCTITEKGIAKLRELAS